MLIGCGLIPFAGVLVPYSQIQAFWRYWLYYLNPFSYLIGALVTPVAWDAKVKCLKRELTSIPLPSNATCGEYMSDFLAANAGYVVDPSSATSCEYCEYSQGADYLKTLNIKAKYYGWRDVSSLPRVPDPSQLGLTATMLTNECLAGRNHSSLLYLLVRLGLPHDEIEEQSDEDGRLVS